MRNKKVTIAIISVVALLLLLIGVTYAYWLVTKTQTNSNIISSACLNITLDNESAAINLGSQYPMSDEDGMKLTPYTFTVTNNCNTSIDYQVALESIGEVATAIATSALKVALDDSAELLSNKATATITVNGAYASHKLGYGTLSATGSEGSSVTHELRIWIDENAPISESNKTYQSKISVTVGQGIDSPYQEDTLAYSILANSGGANSAIVIDETELADRITAERDEYVATSENYYYGNEYTFDESTGTYTLSGEVVQAKLTECRDGSKTCGKYTTKSTSTSGTTLYEITNITSKIGTNYVTAYIRKYTTAFAGIGLETSLNKAQDDLGTSYYFRGAVTNNYVQFAELQAGSQIGTTTIYAPAYYYGYEDGEMWAVGPFPSMEACEVEASKENGICSATGEMEEMTVPVYVEETTPLYWRIVRINGDGTIRLVYDGTEKVRNGIEHGAMIGYSVYNQDYVNLNYEDSDVKDTVDEWYNTHLKTNYSGYIADGIFCNDKEVTGEAYFDENYEEIIEEDKSSYIILYHNRYFAPYTRIVTNKKPHLTCTRKEDKYTTTPTFGNGLLEHPIGLLTADEVVFAGGTTTGWNKNYYLYSGQKTWTLSPALSGGFEPETGDMLYIVGINGGLGENNVYGVGDGSATHNFAVRPVINLRADVEFTGDGSFETPYVIVTE